MSKGSRSSTFLVTFDTNYIGCEKNYTDTHTHIGTLTPLTIRSYLSNSTNRVSGMRVDGTKIRVWTIHGRVVPRMLRLIRNSIWYWTSLWVVRIHTFQTVWVVSAGTPNRVQPRRIFGPARTLGIRHGKVQVIVMQCVFPGFVCISNVRHFLMF